MSLFALIGEYSKEVAQLTHKGNVVFEPEEMINFSNQVEFFHQRNNCIFSRTLQDSGDFLRFDLTIIRILLRIIEPGRGISLIFTAVFRKMCGNSQ